MHIIPYEQVKRVKWKGDSIGYDWALHVLDRGRHDQFLAINFDFSKEDIDRFFNYSDYEDEKTCIVWNYKKKWVAKLFPKNWEIGSYENIDIEPVKLKWERNPSIPESVTFENDPTLTFIPEPWDVKFEFVWYIDNTEIWASKCYPENKISSGVKDMGCLIPIMPALKWERNPSIPESVTFENDPSVNFKFDIWDTDYEYELVWHVKDQDVWAFKCSAENKVSKGVKDMGELTPALPQHLDAVFISYHESNAEENWQRVLEKAPWAKRVDGVKGIFNAHKAAAELSTTDMFYVVDGDAWLVDDFNFDFQPGIFDRECTHIWRARNPINRLAYGYGGVKLFAKQVIDNATNWTTLDMSTTIGSDLKVINKISNITAFNTDELSTWRAAFRECVKLCYSVHQDPNNKENIYRLEAWMAPSNQPFAQYATEAAHWAKEWVQQNVGSIDILRQINDRNWLEQEFNKTYNDN